MQVSKTSNVPFGTKCGIGKFSAELGLGQYDKKLTAGIYEAFNQLSNNSKNDELFLSIGTRKNNKNDVLNISYFNKEGKYQSSLNFDIGHLSNRAAAYISAILTQTYDILKGISTKSENIVSLPVNRNSGNVRTSNKLLAKLITKYGADDSSLLY